MIQAINDTKELSALERKVKAMAVAILEGARALVEIHDRKLHKLRGVDSFEQYAKEHLGISRQRAYQMMDFARVESVVSTVVDEPIQLNERQARVLAALDTPQQQADVWAKAVETAPRDANDRPKVTAAHIAKVAAQVEQPPAGFFGEGGEQATEDGRQIVDERGAEEWSPEPRAAPVAVAERPAAPNVIGDTVAEIEEFICSRTESLQKCYRKAIVAKLREFLTVVEDA